MKVCSKCGEAKALTEFYSKMAQCKACKRAAQTAYRRANVETVRDSRARYYEANREKIRADYAEWYAANTEYNRERHAAYRAEHAEQIAEYQAQWWRDNPDKMHAAFHKRRARKASVDHEPYSRSEIFARWDSICCYCDEPATALDHVTPIVNGGADAARNLVPACKRCNSSKGAKSLADWAETFA